MTFARTFQTLESDYTCSEPAGAYQQNPRSYHLTPANSEITICIQVIHIEMIQKMYIKQKSLQPQPQQITGHMVTFLQLFG